MQQIKMETSKDCLEYRSTMGMDKEYKEDGEFMVQIGKNSTFVET